MVDEGNRDREEFIPLGYDADLEREKTPLEVKEDAPRPWDNMEQKDEEDLLAKYSERAELSRESQRFINDTLRSTAEERKVEFARMWFDEHRSDLREQGVSVDVAEERKAAIAIEKGALRDLRGNEDYRTEAEIIENLNALRVDSEKKQIPVESQFLILNVLEQKAARLRHEIQDMEIQGKSEEELKIKRKSLEDLFGAKKELAEKVSGLNLTEESEKRVSGQMPDKDLYVEQGRLTEIFNIEDQKKIEVSQKQWDSLSDEAQSRWTSQLAYANNMIATQTRELRGVTIDSGDVLVLLAAGYNPADFKEKGIFRKLVGNKFGETMTPADFQKFIIAQREKFIAETDAAAQQNLSQEWQSKRESSVKKETERIIRDLSESPERAIDGIEGMYRRVKDRLISEAVEGDLRREEKTAEQLRVIKREFGRGGIDSAEFFSGFRRLQKETLAGNIEDDSEDISRLLSVYGFKVSPEDLIKRTPQESYGRAVKREKGFLEWILGIVFGTVEKPKKSPGRRR